MAKQELYLRSAVPIEKHGSRLHFLLPNDLPILVMPIELVRRHWEEVGRILAEHDAGTGGNVVSFDPKD